MEQRGWHEPPKRGAVFGITAAVLFGSSAPFAKLLLPGCTPVVLAALLYGGAAVALTVARLMRPGARSAEARLRGKDAPVLAAVILTGGILGPVLMLLGLQRVSGVAGALLLNLEAPFTMIVAVLAFGEHMGRRAILAAALIVGGGTALSWSAGSVSADLPGTGFLAAACFCWAVDNNLTQRLSVRDPISIVQIKAIGAAVGNLALAAVIAEPLVPRAVLVAGALALGALSYGVSILLDVYALRLVGAAREAAYFATAPFLGALLAVPLLGETIAVQEVVAALLMALGVILLVRDRHEHHHVHTPLVHEHVHAHDDHHRHTHGDGIDARDPHSHVHEHEPIEHSHPHVSDVHHRHRH